MICLMREPPQSLQNYYQQSKEIYLLHCVLQVLEWDQQVYMPPQAAEFRAHQIEYMSRLAHEQRTSESYYRLVQELYNDMAELTDNDRLNIALSLESIERSRKLTPGFVARRAKASATAYTAWTQARKQDDFQTVMPFLKENIELAKQEADLLGYEQYAYDALLENYERGSTLSIIKPVLIRLGKGLQQLIPQIQAQQSELTPSSSHYQTASQKQLNSHILEKLGYRFEQGRLDTTTHPFMTTLGPRDKRITTRYCEDNYLSSLLTTLHEAGHALYEMGLKEEYVGTPLGSTESLSIHESQSRIWENIIGRSKPFSEFLHTVLREFFPKESTSLTPEDIWHRLNFVTPSLIRVEADEVSYSIHIIIRLLLESEIFIEGLPVEELPTRWRELYREYLDIEVPNDQAGILQDVHWYGVGFGYFPTYALGNLYSALMMNCIRETIPNLDEHIAQGEFGQILQWLRENVHKHGMRYRGPELAEKLSGQPLTEKPFLQYLRAKFFNEE